ncbi:MAG: hypothetical protein HZA92_09235, partial [Verrucomicrobia bacterium]|nr:hypothetical protein [Verrucomicrobiota bacterium]
IGVVAAGLGLIVLGQTITSFLFLWLCAAVLASLASLLIVRRQSITAKEPFSTPASRRVIGALYAPLCAGAMLTVPVALLLATGRSALAGEALPPLMCVWMGFYGCGLNAAGQYSSRGVRLLGWGFIGAGALLATLFVGGYWLPELASHQLFTNFHAVMGATFGGFHLVAAGYLYLTESRPPTP